MRLGIGEGQQGGSVKGNRKGLKMGKLGEKDKFHPTAYLSASTSSWEAKCKWTLNPAGPPLLPQLPSLDYILSSVSILTPFY